MKTLMVLAALLAGSGCAHVLSTPAEIEQWREQHEAQRTADQPLEIACIQSGGNWDSLARACVRPVRRSWGAK